MEPEQISAKSVRTAAALMESYFIPTAERVYGDAAIPAVDRAAAILIKHLRKSGLSTFNARVVRREIGGELQDPPMMNGACAALEEAGLIRPLPKRAGPGRKSLDYEVNASALEYKT
jgi:hypothetical protein